MKTPYGFDDAEPDVFRVDAEHRAMYGDGLRNGWYWSDSSGHPHGPFATKAKASEAAS